MIEDRWVLDVTYHVEDAPLAFCPLDDDDNVVTGMTLLTDRPPGQLIGVVHLDGQAAVDEWCRGNASLLQKLFPRMTVDKDVES